MNIFFLEFRDPLFSIIVFFALIFIITFLSYWWGRYKRKEDYKHLDRFLKQFRSLPTQDELKELVSRGELSQKSWMLLAASYSKSGNYEKSIDIYNEILKQPDNKEQIEIMYLLGKTYFKAGFLERSKQIFLEILRKNPRTPQALETLLLVYEYMRDYKSALEVLEPLDELKKDVTCDTLYLKALELLNNAAVDSQEKTEKLIELYLKSRRMSYMIFEYLFRVNPKLAWEHFDSSESENLVDLLWNLPTDSLNMDVISSSSYLRELYTARGDINLSLKSSVFEFDALINLRGKTNATLSFEYICSSCKQLYPFAFHRCSSCHSIDTINVEFSLTKDYHRDFGEESNSFQ
ncbi:MAG: tetratricopeptide (TPR) repeat protein [Sulfurimonas sp.]|jgi:tetratricopeptide (TPR) repeat protein|uniref:tetratricopeptide repeat protein n=1 Tax=Sulfurimonas sp. TaxID=2022749 RepID=UPI0039E5575B